ncbi:uroporphyrinogen III synthase [Psychrobacter sp. C 20.9]|uniref:uroporphyrinogen-III synthase n=1 Tax=Psychrobacter sp. C 20.9 TaxID=1926477 RepID=UPI000946DC20|nr:uroporphyrinogen-III synthase [Psychrobacter sp. C 20.9]OLF38756.1 uroporphyrinogen III synthase [Psychrobacter sp. C 20.9]
MSSTSTKARSTHKNQSTDGSVPKIVINTRPIARAAPLTNHLRAAGFTVVEIPMLTLRPRPTTGDDLALMRAWLAGEYKALVIVSPTAASLGLKVWQSLVHNEHDDSGDTKTENKAADRGHKALVTPSPLIAVGQATAAALNQAKIDATNYQVRQPKVANNEGMLAMPEIECLQSGDKLLIWRGLGGRRLLVDTLQARGVHIDSIAWYERSMPTEAMTQYQQWQKDFFVCNQTTNTTPKQAKPIVVVSSGAAFEHWTSIVQGAREKMSEPKRSNDIMTDARDNLPLTLADFSYVVLGERLANMVAAQRLNYWRVEDLAPDTILSAINNDT